MSIPDLPRRFLVQTGETGSYTVWDTVLHAVRHTSRDQLQAEREAADLELRYDAWGLRTAAAVRPVQPVVDVDTWQPVGRLDYWLRERVDQSLVPRFGWYGRVRTDTGYLWIPAEHLRRSETPPPPQ